MIKKSKTLPLATLRFEGKRFASHTLDVDCVNELQVYKGLVVDCAKALWRRRNPDRERLPAGFEEQLILGFSELREGSAIVPLERLDIRPPNELPLDAMDDFDVAAQLIDRTIAAAEAGELLPTELPRSIVPTFRAFGATLRDDETLHLRSRASSKEAAYTVTARRVLSNWVEPTFEDRVDVVGEVSMADVRAGAFALVISPDLSRIAGRFTPAQESEVLDALRAHRTLRLRVQGLGEFAHSDGALRKIVMVDQVSAAPGGATPYVEGVKPIWEIIAEIGESAGDAWEAVPRDLGANLDEYLYGRRKPE